MKHPYHTLLPTYLQKFLMDAVKGGILEIDKVASEMREVSPQRFHDSKSVELRVFYNEPRQSVPSAGFIVPYPTRTRA
jgi:hypothetical protein